MNRLTKDRTPYELYFGSKPRISHIRVFGCVAYQKTQEKKRSGYIKKLEKRSKPVILVGFDRDFSYRLFDPQTGKVDISREVIFDEVKKPQREEPSYENIDEVIDDLPPTSDDEGEEVDIEMNMTTLEVEPPGPLRIYPLVNDRSSQFGCSRSKGMQTTRLLDSKRAL